MDSDQTEEVVDLVHSLFLQSRQAATVPVEYASPKTNVVKSVPSSPSSNVLRSQSFPVRKKVQIKSAPLKPPDISNVSLFPSVEESIQIDCASPKRIPLKSAIPNHISVGGRSSTSNDSNKGLAFVHEGKLKTLEAKLTEPFGSQADLKGTSRRASLNELPTTPNRKTPRSAKLFSDLSPDRRQKLDELAVKYSNAIDCNQCRNVLDELEFIFQLFNTPSITQVKMPTEAETPLLVSVGEHAYFGIKIVINQLDKLLPSLPVCIVQLIIENYPHKIPKPVRKHIDDWIALRKGEAESGKNRVINETISLDLCKTVKFKSEKDGRANFPHQTDFHAFCKQRDMFYFIRENWTCSGSSGNVTNVNGGGGGIITDRNKARMSFPPANITGSSSSKVVDSLPFKVQSLFQMNSKPTNLFHMASLFVSHYLLEARANEVGGVPKDDNMQEFFQSNPNKLLQLNSRFSTASAETLENEQFSNLAFQKEFLLSSSPKFVQHVIDRLVNEITQAEVNLDCDHHTSNPSETCRTIKDLVHLARLLGFSLFLPYTHEDIKRNENAVSIENESIIQEHVDIRNYQKPPLDLNHYIAKAFRAGRLTATCPWVLEYLLQCDSVSLQLPSYQPVITAFFSMYKSVLSMNSCSSNHYNLSNSSKNFLRFYIGMLFSSKIFPDAIFSSVKSQESIAIFSIGDTSSSVLQEGVVDSREDVASSLTEFFFGETFNRLKRILSWGKLEVSHPAMTGDIRHIRPIPATDKAFSKSPSRTVLSKEKTLQSHLEATFFELYPQNVKRCVEFVSERMASNFICIAKTNLFPNFRNMLAHQGVFGVRAAEKCRAKICEEMSKYFTEKCSLSIKILLEQTTTTGVLQICQRVAIRKAKEVGNEWVKNYINAGMFPDIGSDGESGSINPSSSPHSLSSPPQNSKSTPEDPPFEILILIHRMLRRMQSRDKLDPQLIDKVLTCQSLSKASWVFNSLMEWGIGLITFQPKLLNTVRIKQLISIWKCLWNPRTKLINARNLMILSKSEDPRDSWIKLGTVTQHLIQESVIKPDDLEQQCFSLLKDNWHNETHKRISEFLTLVLETFQERAEWHSESAQVLDWVAWLCSGQPDQD